MKTGIFISFSWYIPKNSAWHIIYAKPIFLGWMNRKRQYDMADTRVCQPLISAITAPFLLRWSSFQWLDNALIVQLKDNNPHFLIFKYLPYSAILGVFFIKNCWWDELRVNAKKKKSKLQPLLLPKYSCWGANCLKQVLTASKVLVMF